MKETHNFYRCKTDLAEIVATERGERAVMSVSNFRWFSANIVDASEGGAAIATAEFKIKVGNQVGGPFFDVPSGCIGSGGTATLNATTKLAGPIDVAAFGYVAVVCTTAEASKFFDLHMNAKNGLE